MGAPQGYQASWWVYLLHQVPRTNFQFEVVESSFAPQDREYQQVRRERGRVRRGGRERWTEAGRRGGRDGRIDGWSNVCAGGKGTNRKRLEGWRRDGWS
uniref:Uncharacterized protein n=1 Tax=Chrysemys picta bellii TaxID=8478 RepID=A0A8C3F0J1_CHRPI